METWSRIEIFGYERSRNRSLFRSENIGHHRLGIPHAVEIDLPLIAIMVSRGRQPSDPNIKESEG